MSLACAAPFAHAQSAAGGRAGTIEQENRPAPAPLSTSRAPLRLERPASGPADMAAIKVSVTRIEIDGVTVLPKAEVEAVVHPLEGREITLGELFAAADRITALYSKAGYALSFALVPVQDIKDGVVRLMVIEGRVGKVSVEVKGRAALVSDQRIIRDVLSRAKMVQTGRPVRSAELERLMLTIADLPGVKPTAVFKASADTDGQSDMVITVDVDPLDVQVTSDNRLRADFGSWRYGGRTAARSVLLFGDELSVGTQRAFTHSDFVFDQIGYQAPLGGSGLTFDAAYSKARTSASRGALGRLDFAGDEEVTRLGLSYPIIRSRSHNLILTADATATNSSSGLFGVLLIDDHVRTFDADLAYDWVDEGGGVSLLGFGVEQGVSGLGASSKSNPLSSRLAGTPQFTALTFRTRRDQAAGPFVIRAQADGQVTVAGGDLAPVECVYGGDKYGRAYDSGVIGGDHCLRGSLEVARPWTVSPRTQLEPFAYVDGALVRQKGQLEVGEQRRSSASSTGLGLRISTPKGLGAELLVSVPLQGQYAKNGSDPRAFFSVGYRW